MENVLLMRESETSASRAIKKFIDKKSEKSKNTAISYMGDIVQFVKHVYNKDVEHVTQHDWNRLEEETVVAYFDTLYKQGTDGKKKYKNTTMNRKISSLKELIRYLKKNKVITGDISYFDTIEKYFDDTESIEAMPLDVAKQYAEHFLKTEKFKAYEKHCICLLAIDTGLRVSELLNLLHSQFVLEIEYVIIRGRGKGNKKWIKKISYGLYEKLLQIGNKDGKVFNLSVKNVKDMMNRAKKELNHENRNYSFHSFKKTAVTFGYRQTGDIMEAKRIANHSDLKTTQIYLEEEDYGMSGAISLGETINHNLYKLVDHMTLLEGLEHLRKDSLFLLNIALTKIQSRNNDITENEN